MITHTPGVWTSCDPGDYSDYDGKCIVVLGDDSSIRVAVVLGTSEESIANARLIAAAPGLLRIADLLVEAAKHKADKDWTMFHLAFNEAAAEARTTLAKATGSAA